MLYVTVQGSLIGSYFTKLLQKSYLGSLKYGFKDENNPLPSNSTILAQTLEENARFLILTGNKTILSAQSYMLKPRLRIKLKMWVSPLCALLT